MADARADLMRHLAAIERWMFAENARRRPSRWYEAAVAYMGRMHHQSMEIFRALTDADLEAKCTTPGGLEQIYLDLGMLDVPTPPLYGLTEEEVKRRSSAGS